MVSIFILFAVFQVTARFFRAVMTQKGSKANLGNECPEIVRVDSMHGGITVSWTDVCEDNSKYRIYVKEKGSWKKAC